MYYGAKVQHAKEKGQRVASGRSSYELNSQRAKEKGPLVELKSAREALVARNTLGIVVSHIGLPVVHAL